MVKAKKNYLEKTCEYVGERFFIYQESDLGYKVELFDNKGNAVGI